jgi:excisionase family DNA binding protein
MAKPTVARLAYSPAETAMALNVSVNTIRRCISAKLIRYIPMGRAQRIPVGEVERLAAEGLPAIPRYQRQTPKPTKRGRKHAAEHRASP